MQTITNSAVRMLSFAFAALLAVALFAAITPKAQASDFFDTGWVDTGYSDTWSPSYDTASYDTGWVDTGYSDTWSPSYDTSYSDYNYGSYGGYTSPSYGGYSYPNYTQPNYTRPNYTQPNYTRPTYTSPSYTSPSYTNTWDNGNTTAWDNGNTYTYAPSNTETCNAVNSCNDNSYRDNSIYSPTNIVTDSHNIVTSSFDSHNVYNPYPVSYPTTQVVYASAPVQPTYTQPAYQPTYQPTYQQPRVAYNNPGISLAAVPYTGLDLGPWGTAVYWGFLVLWCLIAAYLIAVKKVQNKFATWLFGSTPVAAKTVQVAPKAAVMETKTAPQFAGIDPFIASQISRAF